MKPQHQTSILEIREQAAQWLTELEDADAQPQVRSECIAWLRTSSVHVKEFLFMSSMWQGLNNIDSQKRMNVDALLTAAAGNVVPIQTDFETNRTINPLKRDGARSVRNSRWMGIAAVVAVVTVTGWFALDGFGDPRHATAVGEQRTVKLSDGSFVQLNTRSRIAVHFNDDVRDIRLLEGEALFTAAQDSTRPFRVYAGEAVIQALGTQFNVYRRERETTLAVIEGAVKVFPQSAAATQAAGDRLKAGEQVSIDSVGKISRRAAVDKDKTLAWRERRLVFHGESLKDVATEVNRYNTGVRIRIEGEAAQQRRLIGVFAADDPTSLLQFLEKEGDLTVEKTSSEIVIRAR